MNDNKSVGQGSSLLLQSSVLNAAFNEDPPPLLLVPQKQDEPSQGRP